MAKEQKNPTKSAQQVMTAPYIKYPESDDEYPATLHLKGFWMLNEIISRYTTMNFEYPLI